MEGAEASNRPEQPATPVVFRAPRAHVVRRLVYAVTIGVLAGVGWSVLHVVWLATVATIACLVQFGATARAAAGTVTVDPEGVRVGTLSATRRYRWAEIAGFDVRATISGRRVRLIRAVPHRRLRLPAPASPYLIPDPRFDAEVRRLRDLSAQPGTAGPPPATAGAGNPRRYWLSVAAMLAVALLLDQPWGWLAGPQAIALPDPCAAAAGHLTAMVGQRTGKLESTRPDSSTIVERCSWDQLAGSPDRFVVVEIERYDRLGLHSGTWRAKANFSTAQHGLAGSAVDSAPRLGDDSVLVESDVGAGIFALRGNVLALVVARGPVPGYNRADLLAVERNILVGIRLG
ncbi:MAG: PH domain-containing protein [Micromonosporaceae bacterium]|nr:PH domain-containing protein [Micromonosporaceae bacterium]